jgi:hypothetical protein
VIAGRKPATDLPLRAALRTAILNFCTVQPWLRRIADQDATDDDIALLPSAHLKAVLADELPYINHIFVHVFDFHYFYDAKETLYLRLLWESWATVPAVLENLEEYLVRSLVTVSTNQDGLPTARFELAVSLLRTVLEALSSDADGLVAKEALHYLNVNQRRLLIAFFPASYLAELAARLLVASGIHASLLEDDNADADENYGCRYVLESGEFVDTPITSPVAFVLDRLRRHLTDPALSRDNEEYLSAWALLVCASAVTSGG